MNVQSWFKCRKESKSRQVLQEKLTKADNFAMGSGKLLVDRIEGGLGSSVPVSVPATPRFTVSVVVVNFRTSDLTIQAVESALSQPDAREIFVVDNASGDGSFERIEAQFRSEPRVSVVQAAHNNGFGAGNNLAAAVATCDLLFLLNSDATFEPKALEKLVNFRTGRGERCIVAPAVLAADSGKLQVDALGSFPTARRILTQQTKQYGTSLTPDWVSGCALLIDRTLFVEISGFDERIFMYFEDVLLCWHARRLGCAVHREPAAKVEHVGGKSYSSSADLKDDYFEAQDIFLLQIGESAAMRRLVKTVRSIVVPMRRVRLLKSKSKSHHKQSYK
jgi:N-acetylglucosaminyl-diphospho-decaprenol L-rhamnosyltransferase